MAIVGIRDTLLAMVYVITLFRALLLVILLPYTLVCFTSCFSHVYERRRHRMTNKAFDTCPVIGLLASAEAIVGATSSSVSIEPFIRYAGASVIVTVWLLLPRQPVGLFIG